MPALSFLYGVHLFLACLYAVDVHRVIITIIIILMEFIRHSCIRRWGKRYKVQLSVFLCNFTKEYAGYVKKKNVLKAYSSREKQETKKIWTRLDFVSSFSILNY